APGMSWGLFRYHHGENGQTAAATFLLFRFRQPKAPSTPSPPANSGSAAGTGIGEGPKSIAPVLPVMPLKTSAANTAPAVPPVIGFSEAMNVASDSVASPVFTVKLKAVSTVVPFFETSTTP